MTEPTILSDQEAIQKLEALKARQATLENQRIRLESKIEAAQTEYQQLSAKAQEQYGTTDLAVLREKQLEMQRANSEAIHKFTADLDVFEAKLQEIAAKVA